MKKTAELLKSQRDVILSMWENEVQSQVKAALSTNKIALLDHVPNILDDIISIMNSHEKTEHYLSADKIQQIEENSLEHGRHRATSPNYTVDQIIQEYMIFNNVIIKVLYRNNVTEESLFHLIKSSIDKAMLNSVSSFTQSIQEMQNKLIGTLAHDIRNPLAAARMAIEMLNYEAGEERLAKVKKMSYNSVKYGESNKPITIKVKDEKDWLNLSVHNFGAPIPKEKQEGIFVFLQHGNQERKEKLKSYGIGLTLVKMVAEAHGGTVDLRSEEGFGTEFQIRLNKFRNVPGKTRTLLNSEV